LYNTIALDLTNSSVDLWAVLSTVLHSYWAYSHYCTHVCEWSPMAVVRYLLT